MVGAESGDRGPRSRISEVAAHKHKAGEEKLPLRVTLVGQFWLRGLPSKASASETPRVPPLSSLVIECPASLVMGIKITKDLDVRGEVTGRRRSRSRE